MKARPADQRISSDLGLKIVTDPARRPIGIRKGTTPHLIAAVKVTYHRTSEADLK